MLTPGFILDITGRTEEATARMNEKLSRRIAKRILAVFEPDKGVAVIPSTAKDFRKMVKSGLSVDEIVDLVSQSMPEIKEEVRRAFYDTAVQVAKESDDFARELVKVSPELQQKLDEAGIKMPDPIDTYELDLPQDAAKTGLSPHELRMMEQAYTATSGMIDNLTRTTATAWQSEFIEVCNDAFWQIQHGVGMNDAICKAIDEAAKYGTHVEYPSGHKDRVEVAVARAVRTGISKAAGDMVLSRCAREGIDYVVVSSHLGARTTDKVEPANHASWQGQVYKLNWDDPALAQYADARRERTERANIFARFFQMLKKKWNDRKYADFVTTTGYGTGAGLCGYNCRHSFTPFYPGVSTNNQKQYGKEENEKAYKLTQTQRAMERQIRELKRRKAAASAALDSAKDQASRESVEQLLAERSAVLHKATLEYNQFCKEHELKTMHERTKVPDTVYRASKSMTLSRARIIKTKTDLLSISNSAIIKMESSTEIADYFKNKFGIIVDGFEKKDILAIQSPLIGYDDMLQEFHELHGKILEIHYSSRMKDNGEINLPTGISRIGKSGLFDYGVGVHEASHMLDYIRSREQGCDYAARIITQARKNLGLKINSREYNKYCVQMVGMVKDEDTYTDPKELFAFGMETAKGGAENPLAKEIYRLAKEN